MYPLIIALLIILIIIILYREGYHPDTWLRRTFPFEDNNKLPQTNRPYYWDNWTGFLPQTVLDMIPMQHREPKPDGYVERHQEEVDVDMNSYRALRGQGGNPVPAEPYQSATTKNWDYDAEGKNTVDYIHENTLWFNNQTLGNKWGIDDIDKVDTNVEVDTNFDLGEYELIRKGILKPHYERHKISDTAIEEGNI